MKTRFLAALLIFLPFIAFADNAAQCDILADPEDPNLPHNIKPRYFIPLADTEKSIEACRAELARNPDNPRIAYQLARGYQIRAIRLNFSYNAHIREEDKNPELLEQSKEKRALAEKYRRQAGNYPAARYRLGIMLIEEKPEEAKALFEGLLKDMPALGHFGLGRYYTTQAKERPELKEKAEAEYRQTIAAGAKEAASRLAKLDKPHEIELLREGAINPPNKIALARTLYEQKNIDGGNAVLAELEEKGKADPDYATAAAAVRAEQIMAIDESSYSASEAFQTALKTAAEGGEPVSYFKYRYILELEI